MKGSRRKESKSRHLVPSYRMMPSIGTRLRELRKRARLSLNDLAYMMGHNEGYRGYLSKLENGRLRFPTLALVADYLRAVGGSFSDLLPLLAEYTKRPPIRPAPVRERVLRELGVLGGRAAVRLEVYDRKQAGRLTPKGRVSAAKKQARIAKERRLLANLMRTEVNRLKVKPTMTGIQTAYDYAWMVWSALELTKPRPRKKMGRPPKTRKQRLEEARARTRKLAPKVLPVRALKQIEGKVTELFEDVHRFEKKT